MTIAENHLKDTHGHLGARSIDQPLLLWRFQPCFNQNCTGSEIVETAVRYLTQVSPVAQWPLGEEGWSSPSSGIPRPALEKESHRRQRARSRWVGPGFRKGVLSSKWSLVHFGTGGKLCVSHKNLGFWETT